MSNGSSQLSDEDVHQIVKLVREVEQSGIDYLRLELGELKVTISKSGQIEEGAGGGASTPPQAAPEGPRQVSAGPRAQSVASGTHAADTGDMAIRAPTVGRFYGQPEPGAKPFVEVGSEVREDTTVGLLEVMKVFNAVSAGVCGVIGEICVQDGQFVEYGQTLFRVRPAPGGSGPAGLR